MKKKTIHDRNISENDGILSGENKIKCDTNSDQVDTIGINFIIFFGKTVSFTRNVDDCIYEKVSLSLTIIGSLFIDFVVNDRSH